jgi:hypothetical protein
MEKYHPPFILSNEESDPLITKFTTQNGLTQLRRQQK